MRGSLFRPRPRAPGATMEAMQEDARTHVVIAGGGFAGVACAKRSR